MGTVATGNVVDAPVDMVQNGVVRELVPTTVDQLPLQPQLAFAMPLAL